MAQINFNANNVAPAVGFEPLPAGTYQAIIEASEVRQTAKGNGSYIQLTFQVVGGAHSGRKLWDRITYTNPSEEAVRIGHAQLSSLCRAVGVMTPKATEELHDRVLMIHVGHEKRSDTGELVNRIKKYEAQATAAPVTIAGAVVDGSSKKSSVAPWSRPAVASADEAPF